MYKKNKNRQLSGIPLDTGGSVYILAAEVSCEAAVSVCRCYDCSAFSATVMAALSRNLSIITNEKFYRYHLLRCVIWYNL